MLNEYFDLKYTFIYKTAILLDISAIMNHSVPKRIK